MLFLLLNIGVDNFYKVYENTYENPHKEIINHLLKDVNIKGSILDVDYIIAHMCLFIKCFWLFFIDFIAYMCYN